MTIAIAGGGTGGHVFPAIAVAEELERLADVEVVFFGTDGGLEARVVPERGWKLERLYVEPMKGGGLRRAVRGGAIALRAVASSVPKVRRTRPRALLSVGGYAAGPVSLAAAALRVPIAVLEPNSVVGLANRLLGPVARRAYIAWDEVAGAFRPRTLRPFGVPLRSGFAPRPYVPRASPNVLIMGGSQGASALNECVPEAIAAVATRCGHAPRVLHQAGRDHDGAVRAAYARLNVEGAAVVPFIDDVARAIGEADVVIARAGAGTIAEITSIGRASILVPFPHAADDHQTCNALALVRRGAAVCVKQEDASIEHLADVTERMLADVPGRIAMASAARTVGRPGAAHDVASDLLRLAGGMS